MGFIRGHVMIGYRQIEHHDSRIDFKIYRRGSFF